jgi:hypothetical protein
LKSNHFPFVAPKILIEVKDPSNYVSLLDVQKASFEDIMKEHWHPSIRLSDIADKTMGFVERNLMPKDETKNFLVKKVHSKVTKSEDDKSRRDPLVEILFSVLIIKLSIAVLTTLGGIHDGD